MDSHSKFSKALLTFPADSTGQDTSTERQEIIREHQETTRKQQFEANKKEFRNAQLDNERRNKTLQHPKIMINKKHQQHRQQTRLYTINEEENDDDSIAQDTTSTKPTVQIQEGYSLKDMTKPQTLRQILQQNQDRTQLKEENKVLHNTSAQCTITRNPDIARSTGAISSTTNFDTTGLTTSTHKDEIKSTLFGTQVSNPITERSPTESQAGRATPPKNIMADTGFAGQHTKPPIRPPSSGPTMSPELQRIYAAVQSEDRTKWRQQSSHVPDPLAALQALLRPRQPQQVAAPPKVEEKIDRTRLQLTTLPQHPVVEVHELEERPVWSGQAIGKTVATGIVTEQWRGAGQPNCARDKPHAVEYTTGPLRILKRGYYLTAGTAALPTGEAASIPLMAATTAVSNGKPAPAEAQLEQSEFDGFVSGTGTVACAFPNPAQDTAIAPPASPTPTLLTTAEAAANSTAVGAPPSAQAEGKGSANAKARSAQAAGKRSRRRDTRSNKVPSMTEPPVSPPKLDVLAGNPFAPLSQLTEESQASPPEERASAPGSSRRVVVGRKPRASEPNPRPQRKAVTLGDFLPTGGVASKREEGRQQRLMLELGGGDESVSARVPQWSDDDRPPETLTALRVTVSLITPRKRRRRIFAGLRGIVSNHFPTYALRTYRSWQQPHRPAAASARQPVVVLPRLPQSAPRAASAQVVKHAQPHASSPPPTRPAGPAPPTPRASPPRTNPNKARPTPCEPRRIEVPRPAPREDSAPVFDRSPKPASLYPSARPAPPASRVSPPRTTASQSAPTGQTTRRRGIASPPRRGPTGSSQPAAKTTQPETTPLPAPAPPAVPSAYEGTPAPVDPPAAVLRVVGNYKSAPILITVTHQPCDTTPTAFDWKGDSMTEARSLVLEIAALLKAGLTGAALIRPVAPNASV